MSATLSLTPETNAAVDELARTFNYVVDSPKQRARFMRQCIERVSAAMIADGRVTLPWAVEMRVETEEETAVRLLLRKLDNQADQEVPTP